MPIQCRYCADTADIGAIRLAMMDSIKIHHKIFFDFGLYEKVLTGRRFSSDCHYGTGTFHGSVEAIIYSCSVGQIFAVLCSGQF